MTRCAYHWNRRHEEIPGTRKIGEEWMCEACFTGRVLEPKSEYMTRGTQDLLEITLVTPHKESERRIYARGTRPRSLIKRVRSHKADFLADFTRQRHRR
jgi:hypothetical protein